MESGKQSPPLISTGPLQIGDLGPDLLTAVFLKLGPSPMHLAALPSVCKAWRKLVYQATFKHLCEERAPAVCKAMGFSAANVPAGGWQALFKMLTFCPGMFEMFSVNRVNPDAGDYGWWNLMGHVEGRGSGFQTGGEVNRDLKLGEEDVLFVTRFCDHKFAGDTRNAQGCAARGLVRNFLGSSIAERSGVTAYLRSSPEVQKQMHSDSHDLHCVYCKAPMLWILLRAAPDGTDQMIRGFITIVQVCLNGHLTLMGLYNGSPPTEAPPSLQPKSSSQGGSQELESLGLGRHLAIAYATDSWPAGSELVESVNALTVAKQLKRLAITAAEMKVGEAFDTEANAIDAGFGDNWERFGPSTDSEVLKQAEAEWHELRCLGESCRDRKIRSSARALQEVLDPASDSSLEEVQDVEPETADPDHATLFWETLPSTSDELSQLFRVVPESEAVMQRYLSNEQSASVTMKQLGRLRTLGFKRCQLDDAHEEMKRRRIIEAENAMRAAGIQPITRLCGGGIFPWPDPWALSDYVSGEGITLNGLIARQRRALEEIGSTSEPAA